MYFEKLGNAKIARFWKDVEYQQKALPHVAILVDIVQLVRHQKSVSSARTALSILSSGAEFRRQNRLNLPS